MLLKYAGPNVFDTSGALGAASGRPSPNGAGALRPPTPFGEFIMCSAGIEGIGLCIFYKHWLPILSKALAIHILNKSPATTCFKASLQ